MPYAERKIKKNKDVTAVAYTGMEPPRLDYDNLLQQNKIENDIFATIGIPYWEHTYIYSIDDL